MHTWFDTLWHGKLGRPYNLATTYDAGSGPGIVLLHGIGRSGKVWRYVTKLLQQAEQDCHVVAYDLLGFGLSPKPLRIEYTVDDHAQAVISMIKRLRGSKPVVLVGHSMGCLVAVRVAALRPNLVRHLVLYEMPLYEGLPDKRRYQTRISLYFKLYDWISKQKPDFENVQKRLGERLATKVVGSEITAETWQPFIRSLKNTIMKQSADTDLPTLPMPADIIYGSRDMFVIRGQVIKTFGLDSKLVSLHTIRERHVLSPDASVFIVTRVIAALNS